MKKILILCMPLLMLTSCRRADPPEPEAELPPELTSVFRSVPEPEEPLGIPQLRKQVSPGDAVVFTAKVMGSKTPFVDGRSLMVVGDEATLTSCDLMGDEDHCKTPWDVCCGDRELISNGVATVQVVNEQGKVLSAGLKGVNGLKELSRVRVKGVVAPMSTVRALVINAGAIEVLN